MSAEEKPAKSLMEEHLPYLFADSALVASVLGASLWFPGIIKWAFWVAVFMAATSVLLGVINALHRRANP